MIHIILKWVIRFILFFASYVVTSRIISIPVALLFGFPRFIVFVMVVILDILQIPMFYHIYDKGFPHIPFLNKILDKLPSKEAVETSAIGKKAQQLGSLGLIFISAAPTFGGGIWSAVLIAQILRLSYWRSFIFIAIGSLLSCIVLVYGYDWIFRILGVFEI